MNACQICDAPMISVSTETPYGIETLAVCSKYVVHPATYFGFERLARLRNWRAEHQAGAPLNGVTR